MDLVVARAKRSRGRSSRLAVGSALDCPPNSSPEWTPRMTVSPHHLARSERYLCPKAWVSARNTSAPVNGYLNQSLKDDPLTSETFLTKPVQERRKLRDRHLHYLLPIAQQKRTRHFHDAKTDGLMDEIVAPIAYVMDHTHDRDASLSPGAMSVDTSGHDTPPSSGSCPSLMSAPSSAGGLVPDQTSKSPESQLRKLVGDLFALWPEGIPAYYGLTSEEALSSSHGGQSNSRGANNVSSSQQLGSRNLTQSSSQGNQRERGKAEIKRGRRQRAAAGDVVKEWRCLHEAVQGDESCNRASRSEFSSMVRHMRNSHSESLYDGVTFMRHYDEESRHYIKTNEQACELLAVALFRRMSPGTEVPYLRFERLPDGARRPLPLPASAYVPLQQASQPARVHDRRHHDSQSVSSSFQVMPPSPIGDQTAPPRDFSSSPTTNPPPAIIPLDPAISTPTVTIAGSTFPTATSSRALDNVITHLQIDPLAYIGYTEQLNNVRAAMEKADRHQRRLKRRYEEDIRDVEEEAATGFSMDRADKRRRLNEIDGRYENDTERIEQGRSRAIASARTRIEEIAHPYLSTFRQQRSPGLVSDMGERQNFNNSQNAMGQHHPHPVLTPPVGSPYMNDSPRERSATPTVDFVDNLGFSNMMPDALSVLPPPPPSMSIQPVSALPLFGLNDSAIARPSRSRRRRGTHWTGPQIETPRGSFTGASTTSAPRQRPQQIRADGLASTSGSTAMASKPLRGERDRPLEPTIIPDSDLDFSGMLDWEETYADNIGFAG